MKELFEYLIDKEPDIKLPLKIKLVSGFHINIEDLNISGSLDLSDSKITSLPDNLNIYYKAFIFRWH